MLTVALRPHRRWPGEQTAILTTMTWFLTLAVIVGGVLVLFRYLRKREIEAFRDADISAFGNFGAENGAENRHLSLGSSVVPNRSAREVASQPDVAERGAKAEYELKDAALDDVHRSFLLNLHRVIDGRYLVLAKAPLSEFLRGRLPVELSGKSISFLLCDRASVAVSCGIHLREAGKDKLRQSEQLQEAFGQIDRPLYEFPLTNGISVAEIQETLQPLLAPSPTTRNCPKCGRNMVM